MAAVKLLSGLILFFIAGHVVLKCVDRKNGARLGRVAWAAFSFMLGLGAVSLQMFLYSLISVPFGPAVISAPWIVLGAVTLFHPAFRGTPFPGCGERMGWPGVVILALICSQVAYAFAYAIAMPLSGWDAWFIWFVKARAFFMDAGVQASFLTDPVYQQDHPEYPLLVPLAVAWMYTAVGSAGEWAGKAVYPVQFAALLAIFHYGALRFAGKTAALVFTALLSVTPLVLVHAAGFPVKIEGLAMGDFTGYADLTLAAYFLGAAIFLVLYAKEGGLHFAALSSVMLAMSAWTKNEGLTFSLLGLASLAFLALRGEKRDLRALAVSAAVLALFIAPWSFFKSAHGLSSEYVENMGAAVFFANVSRLGEIIPYMAKFMFLKPGITNLVWWAYVVSFVLCARAVISSRSYVLHWLIFGQLAAYIFVYMITPVDLKWHLATSVDRLVLHLVPLGMLAAAMNLSTLAGGHGHGEGR